MAKIARENRVPIMMSAEELKAIDEWRFHNHIATRSDAIRRLAFNGLVAHEEVTEALTEAEAVWDEVSDWDDKLYRIMMQTRGRHAHARPPVEPRAWTAEEVVDLNLQWTTDLIDRCHVLYLDLLRLNNRVHAMSNAPHVTRGRRASRKERDEIDAMRAEIFKRREQGEEDRRMSVVSSWLRENPVVQERVLAMDDITSDEWFSRVDRHVKTAAERTITFTEDEINRVTRRPHEPYDFVAVATVIGTYVLLDQPKKPSSAYVERALGLWPTADRAMLEIMVEKAKEAAKEDGFDVSA